MVQYVTWEKGEKLMGSFCRERGWYFGEWNTPGNS